MYIYFLEIFHLQYYLYLQDHDIELAKLALWYSMQCKDIATYLVGIQNVKELNINLDVIRNGITEKEKNVLQEIQEKYVKEKNSLILFYIFLI